MLLHGNSPVTQKSRQ